MFNSSSQSLFFGCPVYIPCPYFSYYICFSYRFYKCSLFNMMLILCLQKDICLANTFFQSVSFNFMLLCFQNITLNILPRTLFIHEHFIL